MQIFGLEILDIVFLLIILWFVAIIILELIRYLTNFSKSVVFCNVMGWHRPPPVIYVEDDCSTFTGKCARCNKEVQLDSKGKWV